MNYPQLYLPKGFVENFDKIFPPPSKPQIPIPPEKPSKSTFFIVLLSLSGLAGLMILLRITELALIFIGLAIFLLFSNSDKKKIEDDVRLYNKALAAFPKAQQQYITELELLEIHHQTFQEYKRNQANEILLKKSCKHLINQDYKKGTSHNYFKSFLLESFGEDIVESASINNTKYSSYQQNNFNLYITDFAYIDKYINLKIDIEIDEPYTFDKKQPIHLNDQDRNNFFNENNWVVVRFAEEQVVRHPEMCCEYIRSIINCFYSDFMSLKNLKHNLPEVTKWNSQSITRLIAEDYREGYLEGKVYFTL